MRKVSNWIRVILFFVIVGAAIVFIILPMLGTTAPGGPKLSFGGSETCQLGDTLEKFNAAGLYMGKNTQDHTYTGLSSQDNLAVYPNADRAQSCGKGHLVNKGDKWLKGVECMVYSFELRYADGGRMTCDGVETLGSTREAIRSGLGNPEQSNDEYDKYIYKKSGRTYTFYFYYDESGVCTSAEAYQNDPKLSFQSF